MYYKEKYGNYKEFGYKDFILMFKGEKFDVDEWVSLFKEVGVKYVVLVVEYYDGFVMYDLKFMCWNVVDMGFKWDILKEFMDVGRKYGMKVGVFMYFVFNWVYFNKKLYFDMVDFEYVDFYGKKGLNLKEFVSDEFKELWWKCIIDIIDNY